MISISCYLVAIDVHHCVWLWIIWGVPFGLLLLQQYLIAYVHPVVLNIRLGILVFLLSCLRLCVIDKCFLHKSVFLFSGMW